MNLLITGAWQRAKEYITQLEEMGHSVVFLQQEKDNLPCDYSWVEGVICNGLFLHHDITQFTNLKYIQLTSAGFDRVPLDYINEKEIMINNARGVYSISMAEYALSTTLYIYKQLEFFRNNQRKHSWEKHRGLLELSKKNVCIVGYGSVGVECAKRFKAFGCHVVGVDNHMNDTTYCDMLYHSCELKEVIKNQDIIVLCLPLTDESYHLINAEALNNIKKSAILINISRGQIIDTDALITRLKDNDMYVVLDVFEEEPLHTNSLLWDMENVIVTPHNSFVGDNNQFRLGEVIMNNIKNFIL